MQESSPAPKEISPLYSKEIHMLEGLEDEELERYLDKNPCIVPLFEIDVGKTAESNASPIETTTNDDEPGEDAIAELRRAQEVFKRKMEINGNFAPGRHNGTRRNKCGNDGRPANYLHRQELTADNKIDDGHTLIRMQRCLRLVTRRHEGVGFQILSTSDQPCHRRETSPTIAVPDEPELRDPRKRRNQQNIKNRVHTTSEKSDMAEPHRRSTQEKRENQGLCRLQETQCRHSHQRIPPTVYGQCTGCRRRARNV